VEEALKSTCHVARIRSVAYGAGRCAYYARMIEKMGVFEVISESVSGKGKQLHALLAYASQDLFAKHTLYDILLSSRALIPKTVNEAAYFLGYDDKKLIEEAYIMMQKLIEALFRAQQIMGFNPEESRGTKLFPIIEQELIDFDDHMYGVPDLILEDSESGKAIVVEWKTYEVKGSRWTDIDVAQVVAYSIVEARRLGIKGVKNVFKAIAGIDTDIARRAEEHVNSLKKAKIGQQAITTTDIFIKSLNSIKEVVRKELKVLPIIVSGGKSSNFPPHPLMYEDSSDVRAVVRRFAKLYKIFKGVLVAAEHLTLQLTNVEGVLAEVRGLILKDVIRQLDECCKSEMGYAFNYTPRGILPYGIPKNQKKWPCVTKKGEPFCPFAGEDNACIFYFGLRDKEDFEKYMWKLRYNIFMFRDRSLANYKAIDILFRKKSLVRYFLSEARETCKGFEVDVAEASARIERSDSAIFYIKVKRGKETLSKLRFDIIDINDIDEGGEENSLIAKRKLRDVENRKRVIGTVKRSVVASILESKTVTPLLSINTFLMVGDCDSDGNEVFYYFYSPSLVLYHNFNLFKRYIEIIKKFDSEAKLLLFEAPVNLTLMELRAVDALQRYVALVSKSVSKISIPEDISEDEIRKEIEIIRDIVKKSFEKSNELEFKVPAYEIFGKMFQGRQEVRK
jgi:hypothetical protein